MECLHVRFVRVVIRIKNGKIEQWTICTKCGFPVPSAAACYQQFAENKKIKWVNSLVGGCVLNRISKCEMRDARRPKMRDNVRCETSLSIRHLFFF